MWLSISADKRLFAAVIACISPVKCRFKSSIGITCEYPPPAAPPFIPKTGPNEGSLKATPALTPIFFRPSARPTEIVVLPSPAGVGLIAVTNINLPSGCFFNIFEDNDIFAL